MRRRCGDAKEFRRCERVSEMRRSFGDAKEMRKRICGDAEELRIWGGVAEMRKRSCEDAKKMRRCEGASYCTIAQNLDRATRRPVYFTKIWIKRGPFRYRSVGENQNEVSPRPKVGRGSLVTPRPKVGRGSLVTPRPKMLKDAARDAERSVIDA
jgi:hypothetical protein